VIKDAFDIILPKVGSFLIDSIFLLLNYISDAFKARLAFFFSNFNVYLMGSMGGVAEGALASYLCGPWFNSQTGVICE
jgi:hypothetical protein